MKILKSKQRLRANNEYYDVYIEGYKTQAELLSRQDKRRQLLRNTGDIVRKVIHANITDWIHL